MRKRLIRCACWYMALLEQGGWYKLDASREGCSAGSCTFAAARNKTSLQEVQDVLSSDLNMQIHTSLHRFRATTCSPGPQRRHVRITAPALSEKKCYPCESAKDSMEQMGLSMKMHRETAQRLLAQVHPGWRIVEDDQNRLRIRRSMRTKNFNKALELFQRIGVVAEAEGHHPDLHLVGWNSVDVEVWTHSRAGLSENDFILAAKIDALDMSDLLSKKQPQEQGSSN